jgi:uncharacterized protein YeaO (DUF488 family)
MIRQVIRVKRVYDPPEADDGERILVDRMWPRGLSRHRAAVKRWMRNLAPSDGLRKWFGHDQARWEEFKKRYHSELEMRSSAIEEIRTQALHNVVTLVFAARDAEHNNAVALREYLQKWPR